MSDFPTADQVASALVEAAKIHSENAMSIALCQRSRSRHIAFAALLSAFPEARKMGLARCCGYLKPDLGTQLLKQARGGHSWDEGHVDEIVGALVEDQFGERAA